MTDQLVRHRNVYADTSGVRRFDLLAAAVRRAGPAKVLFGTDGPWLHPSLELEKVRGPRASGQAGGSHPVGQLAAVDCDGPPASNHPVGGACGGCATFALAVAVGGAPRTPVGEGHRPPAGALVRGSRARSRTSLRTRGQVRNSPARWRWAGTTDPVTVGPSSPAELQRPFGHPQQACGTAEVAAAQREGGLHCSVLRGTSDVLQPDAQLHRGSDGTGETLVPPITITLAIVVSAIVASFIVVSVIVVSVIVVADGAGRAPSDRRPGGHRR